ncbi:hypothetical protein SAMN02745121_09099 [Nannocystis exedens]|uniref:Uncharacterized protein n=1 Tax=Nannocystis exedens TaxID=54 RepID=A0A1I2J0N9_9BACT|nr:hypothetical protein NAEX_02651 [Nannocystis exedens]SFF47570.1 hypothetical protein SAMN02745121_09099 [Nannocystis exedens]
MDPKQGGAVKKLLASPAPCFLRGRDGCFEGPRDDPDDACP